MRARVEKVDVLGWNKSNTIPGWPFQIKVGVVDVEMGDILGGASQGVYLTTESNQSTNYPREKKLERSTVYSHIDIGCKIRSPFKIY